LINKKIKIRILAAAIILLGSIAFAQNINSSEVPVAITSKFYILYYDCKPKQWKKEGGNYETEFTQNTTRMRIIIDPKGNVIRTITIINLSDLPWLINNYVTNHFSNKKITEAIRVNEPGGKVRYEAKVNEVHLYFDEGGNFIKSEK
jgi:hypothetical protein